MAKKITLASLNEDVEKKYETLTSMIEEIWDKIDDLGGCSSASLTEFNNDMVELKSQNTKQQDKINLMNYINTKLVKQLTDIAKQISTNTEHIKRLNEDLDSIKSSINGMQYGNSIDSLLESTHTIDSSLSSITDRVMKIEEKIKVFENALNVVADKTLVNIKTTKELSEELQAIRQSRLLLNRMDVLQNLIDDINYTINRR